MIRVGNLSLFSEAGAGEFVAFPNSIDRTVRITFNAPRKTALYLVPHHNDGSLDSEGEHFLALVEGLEEVEFYAFGGFSIYAEDTVFLKTIDGQQIHAELPDAETYTRIMERRMRDPVVEQMQHMLLMNQERRMAPVLQELMELRNEVASRAVPDPATAGAPVAPVAPQPPAGGGGANPASAEPPQPGTGGTPASAS